MLQQYALYSIVIIERVNLREQFFGCGAGGEFDLQGIHTDAAAGVAFHFDVGGRGWVIAHQDSGEYGGNAGFGFNGRYPVG